MPSKNRVKIYAEDAFYHIYNRGVEKRMIFIDQSDYYVMQNILKRHLSAEIHTDKKGRAYRNYHEELELLAFCLMPNHFHMLVYQQDNSSMESFMRSTMVAYSRYFNDKYGRVGGLFQDRYKASMISTEDYLWHISRYIHLNPMALDDVGILDYPHSSVMYYLGEREANWIQPQRILSMHEDSKSDYRKFLNDWVTDKNQNYADDFIEQLAHV